MNRKYSKNNSLEARRKHFYILAILFVVVFLGSLSSVSAGLLDSKTSIDTKGGTYTLGTQTLSYNKLWETYQPIEIKSLLGEVKFQGALVEHTASCSSDCKSKVKIYLPEQGTLIEDIIWKRSFDGGKTWIEWKSFTDWNVIIKNEKGQIFSYNPSAYYDAGTYEVTLYGNKKASTSLDWVIKTQGKLLSEWATWGNISTGSQAEVRLNSPTNGATSYNTNTLFNSSANVTGGASLVNMSLWTNITGSWSQTNTTLLSTSGILINNATQVDGSGAFSLVKTVVLNTSSYVLKTYSNIMADSGAVTGIHEYNYANGTKVNVSSGDICSLGVWKDFNSTNPNTGYLVDSIKIYVRSDNACGTTGAYHERNTIVYGNVTTTYSTQTWNATIPAGSTLWNVKGCDSDGDCGFAPSNFTIYLDSTAPTISVIAPNSTFDYLKNGTLLNLSVTATDTNLQSCWYSYNNTNYTFACSSGVNANATITQNPSRFNITVFANDTVGNVNSSTKSWSYQIFENNQTYDTNVVETSTEEFNISINYFNTLWNTITANLEYDGTNYSATQHGTGNTITFSKSLNIPAITLASENKTFFWYFTLTNSTGSFTYKSGANVQNVSGINIHPCTGGEIAYINFTTRNAENPFGLLNATFKSSWLLKNTGGSGLTTNYSYEDITETNSSWRFCVTPGVNYTISVDIEIDAEDYAKNFYYFPDANYTVNSTTNITLYLLNDTKATPTTLRTVDNAQTRLPGVLVYIDAYDIGTSTYYNVGMAKTNNNGEDIVYLNWYDTLYRFRMYQNGVNTYTSNDSKIFDTPKIFELAEDLSFSFDKFRDFEYSLTFNNVSRIFTLTFVKPNAQVDQGCLKVIKREATNDTNICSTCVTSDSATINCDVSAYGNGTFIAAFYATGSFSLVNLLTENVGSTFAKQINDLLNKDDAAFYSIFMSLIVLAMFLITPVLGVIGIILGLLVISALGFASMSYTYFVGIIIIGVIIIWILKR